VNNFFFFNRRRGDEVPTMAASTTSSIATSSSTTVAVSPAPERRRRFLVVMCDDSEKWKGFDQVTHQSSSSFSRVTHAYISHVVRMVSRNSKSYLVTRQRMNGNLLTPLQIHCRMMTKCNYTFLIIHMKYLM
jgi:hypothetical protein